MDARGAPDPPGNTEREHLARAHDEICTALTVLCSNVELVRIRLRDAPLPEHGIPVHAHLDELDGAVARLRDMAHEMKRWHDGIPPPPGEEAGRVAARRGTPLA